MTVRAYKPEFNFREKLKELDYARVPYHKMPHGSIVQVSTFTITAEVTFNTTNFATAYTHPFKPKNYNSKIIHHFWAKTYMNNVSANVGQDYRLLGGSPNLDIGSHETIIQASWQNYFNRVQYARDYYPPMDFIAVHRPGTADLYNYSFQGRRYAGLSTNAEWKVGDTNMSGGPSQRGAWIIYEVAE